MDPYLQADIFQLPLATSLWVGGAWIIFRSGSLKIGDDQATGLLPCLYLMLRHRFVTSPNRGEGKVR
jgi:hypothetical protein